MLIICDKLNAIVTLKSFDIEESIDSTVQKELNDINTRIMSHAYNHGSTENAQRASKLAQYRYLETIADDKKYKYCININEIYKLNLSKAECDNIYKELKNAIKENLQYFEITADVLIKEEL